MKMADFGSSKWHAIHFNDNNIMPYIQASFDAQLVAFRRYAQQRQFKNNQTAAYEYSTYQVNVMFHLN